jgi:hypothetical protein
VRTCGYEWGLGDNAVLIGAAELAFSEILVGPLETLARAGA